MKKLMFLITFILSAITFFSGCAKDDSLTPYLSELRSDVFYGTSINYQVKAGYGFKKTISQVNGKSENVYSLTFKLLDKETSDVTYNLSFSVGENTYSSTFKLNPITHTLSAVVEIDDFNLKEFTVQISTSSLSESVTLKSTLPENTISYQTALKCVQENQSQLIKNYIDQDGNFSADVCARVIVKNDKSYWYIGFTKNGTLKALLVDGLSGEILAIREIF